MSDTGRHKAPARWWDRGIVLAPAVVLIAVVVLIAQVAG